MKAHVEELFHEVADLSEEGRSLYFLEHNVDPETRSEVAELLKFDAATTLRVETDVAKVAQQALAWLTPKGRLCGPYRIERLIGSGGMGSVYLAERADGEISQRVAIKFLRPGADCSILSERFLAERQILANLSHPNIARLLDAGRGDDGQPYLVMEYIEGQPINVYTNGFSIWSKVTLFLKVCRAVEYLHRNLVVHRDLKPLNILVTADVNRSYWTLALQRYSI